MSHEIDIWAFVAGLGLFLFGIQLLENGLTKLAGRSFKQFLRKGTQTPIKAIFGGLGATAVLQSSSVVMLMVLAFVGAGILTLQNALGIILGANLGTTITGWIVATFGFKFDIEATAFVMAGLGGLLYVFAPSVSKIKSVGTSIAGFGLLFVGLASMKSGVESLTLVLDWERFVDRPLVVFVGVAFVFTAIIQSSSATMVITLSALTAGILDLRSAAAVVIGADLGTTVTAMVGAIRGTTDKKRVAAAHFLFNLVTDVVAFMLLVPLLYFIQNVIGISEAVYVLVAFHSSFNVIGILVFFPFLEKFSTVLKKLFRETTSNHTTYLPKVSTKVPEAAVDALVNEAREIVFRAMKLNAIPFGTSGHVRPITRFLSDAAVAYEQAYLDFKQLESESLVYSAQIDQTLLPEDERAELQRALRSIRESVHAAKCVKDIVGNLDTMHDAEQEDVRGYGRRFREQYVLFLKALAEILDDESPLPHGIRLQQLQDQNQQDYDQIVTEIYQSTAKELPTGYLSTLLNVNRELFSSKKSFLTAGQDAFYVS